MFETLSGMKSLRLLDLSDMSMLKGPLVPKGVAPAKAGLCQLVTRQLLVLNLAEIGARLPPAWPLEPSRCSAGGTIAQTIGCRTNVLFPEGCPACRKQPHMRQCKISNALMHATRVLPAYS